MVAYLMDQQSSEDIKAISAYNRATWAFTLLIQMYQMVTSARQLVRFFCLVRYQKTSEREKQAYFCWCLNEYIQPKIHPFLDLKKSVWIVEKMWWGLKILCHAKEKDDKFWYHHQCFKRARLLHWRFLMSSLFIRGGVAASS